MDGHLGWSVICLFQLHMYIFKVFIGSFSCSLNLLVLLVHIIGALVHIIGALCYMLLSVLYKYMFLMFEPQSQTAFRLSSESELSLPECSSLRLDSNGGTGGFGPEC